MTFRFPPIAGLPWRCSGLASRGGSNLNPKRQAPNHQLEGKLKMPGEEKTPVQTNFPKAKSPPKLLAFLLLSSQKDTIPKKNTNSKRRHTQINLRQQKNTGFPSGPTLRIRCGGPHMDRSLAPAPPHSENLRGSGEQQLVPVARRQHGRPQPEKSDERLKVPKQKKILGERKPSGQKYLSDSRLAMALREELAGAWKPF